MKPAAPEKKRPATRKTAVPRSRADATTFEDRTPPHTVRTAGAPVAAAVAHGPAVATNTDARCAHAVAALKARASEATRAGMARYAIPNDKAFGVSMRDVQSVARRYRYDHALAQALWQTGFYEARMLACHTDDPALVDAAQMERWMRDVDNWAHCDTLCFVLFDRTPHAWKKVDAWAGRRSEFTRRGAFALLASLTVHDKQAGDEAFLRGLQHIEAAADDGRNFVRKAVNWALRSIGKRNAALHAAALSVAQRLAAREEATPRWIGKDALRELGSAAVTHRLAAKKPGARKV